MRISEKALICLNGHIRVSSYYTEDNILEKYCIECGERLISKCQNCSEYIQGENNPYDFSENQSFYTKPKYCHLCGEPYPWTEKKIKAAIELAELESIINEQDKEEFKQDVYELAKNSPQSQVSAKRLSIILSKVADSPAVQAIRNLFVDISSKAIAEYFKP